MIFREIRRCKTKGALEVVPVEALDLRLGALQELLAAARFRIIANAGILLVVARDDLTETTLWEDGKMLVKTLDAREAHKSAARVFEAATGAVEESDFQEYVAAGRVKA